MPLIDLHAAASKTLAIIMGGGAGTRLFPLTKERSKPAVPLAGKYRIVDIPISNCINSGLRPHLRAHAVQLRVAAQAHPRELQVRQFLAQLRGNPRRAADADGSNWYQGTADAVRQNLRDFLQCPYEYFVILSGDQLYRMDYREVLAAAHRKRRRT